MHSINPLFSIVISTTTISITTITINTITNTTITITTDTITSICYFTPRLFFHEIVLFPPTSEAQSTATSLLRVELDPLLTAKLLSTLPAKPDPSLPPSSQRSLIAREVRVSIPPLPAKPNCQRWESAFHHYQLTPSEARLSEVRVRIPLLPACFQRSQIHR